MIRYVISVVSVFLVSGCVTSSQNVIYSKGDYNLGGKLCKPEGDGSFPAIIYNHGGAGQIIGGAPEENCLALAEAGFVGFAPIRRPTRPLFGHLDDVNNSVDYLKKLPFVESSRIGIIGFSRGALLTYQVAIERQEFRALVIMASAVNPSMNLSDAGKITAPVLVLVSENDTGSKRTHGRNTLRLTKELFKAFKEAGKDAKLIVYPPYGNDGHTMFFSVGSYWKDVIAFLRTHI